MKLISKILSLAFIFLLLVIGLFPHLLLWTCGIYLVIGITYYFSKGLREMIQGIQEERAEKKSKKEK